MRGRAASRSYERRPGAAGCWTARGAGEPLTGVANSASGRGTRRVRRPSGAARRDREAPRTVRRSRLGAHQRGVSGGAGPSLQRHRRGLSTRQNRRPAARVVPRDGTSRDLCRHRRGARGDGRRPGRRNRRAHPPTARPAAADGRGDRPARTARARKAKSDRPRGTARHLSAGCAAGGGPPHRPRRRPQGSVHTDNGTSADVTAR
jgi:hypothetical protein